MITTSATPSKDAKLSVHESGEYWVESKIQSNAQTFNVYETFEVESVSKTEGLDLFEVLKIPESPIIIVFFIIIAVALFSVKIRYL